MLLSDRDLIEEIRHGGFGIEPFDLDDAWRDGQIQPASIDVHLDRRIRRFRLDLPPDTVIDSRSPDPNLTELVELRDDEPFALRPGVMVLGSTVERIAVPDHLAVRVEGKSSLGRIAVKPHSAAGFVDPGFRGHVTLELSLDGEWPVMLWPGMRIGQLCAFRLTSRCLRSYGPETGAHYQGQRGPTPSAGAQ